MNTTAKELVELQQQFFNSNKTKDIEFRIEQLQKFKKLLKNNEAKLYDAIYKDFRKSEFETYETELSLIYHELNTAIRKVYRWSKRKLVWTNIPHWPAISYKIPEPLGNSLVIGAWNYPYLLTLQPAVGALAAGNPVIVKPSEIAPHTSAVMAKLFNNAFPTEVLHVYEGGIDQTTELLNQNFKKIFYTGSTAVGKIIMAAAAKNLTPVTLELGGKSPAFVLKDANLKITAKRMVWAKFMNAGQTCVAPDYVLVDTDIKDKFLTALKDEITGLYEQNYINNEAYVQIISEKHYQRLMDLIEPEKVYLGGTGNNEQRIIEPTIINHATFDDKVMQDEIFGPILPVISFTDIDWAIDKVKARPKPLAAYVYTKSKKLRKKLLHEVSFGGGCVNDSVVHLSVPGLPFGGVGSSGMGNYHGKHSFNAFTHYKSILQKPFLFEPPVKYPPYKKWKLKLLKRILE